MATTWKRSRSFKKPRRMMACGFTIIFFHFLITTCAYGDNVVRVNALHQHRMDGDAKNNLHDEEINVLRLHSMDGDAKYDHDHLRIHGNQVDDSFKGVYGKRGHAQTPHMGHMMDPSLNVFFVEKDLNVGRIMPIYFPNRNPSSSPHFLPTEEADSIPFSSSKLPYLLQFFSFSEGSPQAKAMGDTLTQCELEPIKGETKFCPTSLESMLDFTRGIFGMGTHFKILTTTHHRKSTPAYQTPLLQNYTILEITREISATKMVACHTMPYPYAVFYCHHQESKSKVFIVSVIGEYGERVEAVVVCHMDTSAWDPEHVSFRMLGIKPGTAPVCHFFPEDHLVWVPSPSSSI